MEKLEMKEFVSNFDDQLNKLETERNLTQLQLDTERETKNVTHFQQKNFFGEISTNF